MMFALNDRKISGLSLGIDFSIAADEEGNVFVWGKNEFVQRIAGASKQRTMTKTMAASASSSSLSSDDDKPVKRLQDKTIGMKMRKAEIAQRQAGTR